MRIYIAHSTDIDYENEIYQPLRSDEDLKQQELILPHEKSEDINNTREDYRTYDMIIAECSKPSTGVGIELGWCYDDGKPIYGFYKIGAEPSDAISVVVKNLIEYKDKQDLVNKIKSVIMTEKEVY